MNLLFQGRMQAQSVVQSLWVTIFLTLLFSATSIANAQQYASAIISESNVTSSSNSIDSNTGTYSELEAGTGIIIGIGSYSAHIEIQFPTVVPANQTSYVRIETEDNILSSLMGGTLGNLLSGISGVALVGNQEFGVEAKNGATVVLSGNSTNPLSFAGERLKVVVDTNNHTYLAITPNQPYQSIRITNYVGSLVGLGVKKRLRVWDPYYVVAESDTAPQFTSYDAAGISLELLNLGGGANHLERAVDGNETSHSTLSLGVVSVASNITQRFYFEGFSQSDDVFTVRLGMDPALLAITLGQGVRIRTQNGAIVVTNDTLQALLTLANINDLQSGNPTTISITPGAPVDRLVVELNGLLGVTVSQSLDIHEVSKPSSDITASAQPVEGGNVECEPNPVVYGGTTICTATPNVGYHFTGWSGDCSGTELTCTLEAVTAGRSVLAGFAPLLEEELILPEGPQAGQGMHLAVANTNAWQLAEAQAQTVAGLVEPPPAEMMLLHGVVRLRLVLGDQGTDATVVLTYPQPLPPGTVYYKYGPTLADPTPHWYVFPHAQISGNTITLTLTDGDAGDGDLTANREINDPGGPAILASSGVAAVPSLSQWATMVLAGVLAVLGIAVMHRHRPSGAASSLH